MKSKWTQKESEWGLPFQLHISVHIKVRWHHFYCCSCHLCSSLTSKLGIFCASPLFPSNVWSIWASVSCQHPPNAMHNKETANPWTALSPWPTPHGQLSVPHCLPTPQHMEAKCCQQCKWWFRSIWAQLSQGGTWGMSLLKLKLCFNQAMGALKRNCSNISFLLPPANLISASSLPISKTICTDIYKKKREMITPELFVNAGVIVDIYFQVSWRR